MTMVRVDNSSQQTDLWPMSVGFVSGLTATGGEYAFIMN